MPTAALGHILAGGNDVWRSALSARPASDDGIPAGRPAAHALAGLQLCPYLRQKSPTVR